jgi:hypothetical protein
MPGFLSLYDEELIIDVAKGYWVKIKKYLTAEEANKAKEPLIRTEVRGRTTGQPNGAHAPGVVAAMDRAKHGTTQHWGGASGTPEEQAAAQAQAQEAETDYRMKPDISAYQTEMVVLSIVDWNLTDHDGNVLPLTPMSEKRRSVSRLPSPVFEQLYAEVNNFNSEQSPEEEASFRAEGEGSAQDQGTSHNAIGPAVDPAQPDEVRSGAGAVEAPGNDAGRTLPDSHGT